MNPTIMPVTDLRRKTREVIRQVQEGGNPVYITQHGRPAVVIIDFEQYQALTQEDDEERRKRQLEAADLIESWLHEGDLEEQAETLDALIKGLDENRTSYRKLFPEELKGITW